MGLKRSGGLCALALAAAFGAAPKKSAEPQLSSIYPAAAQRESAFEAEIRGAELDGARAVVFQDTGLEARVLSAGADLAHVRIAVAPDARQGRHEFRVVTPRGVTNKLALDVVAEPVVDEKQAGETLRRFPLVINGRLAQPGESDAYWIEVAANQTLTFEAGAAEAKFDPELVLYEPSGSWFDPHRLNRIGFNDEPLYFPGLSTGARLVQHFARGGRYCVQVQGFSGQGGPDFAYHLRISPGVTPAPVLHPPLKPAWEERQFTRPLERDRLADLARRGGTPGNAAPPEVFHAAAEDAPEISWMAAPGMVEGRITHPGEAHAIRLRVNQAEDLAIEIETPGATLPRFNPVVRLMEPGGREMATDVYTKLNNNGLYMMKMIEAKTTVSLRAPGEYRMQIRDITTDCAGDDFLYRVLVRPQIPHVGKVEVEEDHVNLEAGASRPVNVRIDREEGFSDYVAMAVEGLPPGVTAVPALENPPEKPPLPNGGKLERYVAREQSLAVMLVAAPDAPLTTVPARARVVVRVVHGGQLQPPIAEEEIPVMVIARRPS